MAGYDTQVGRLLEVRTKDELTQAAVEDAASLVSADSTRVAALAVGAAVGYEMVAQKTAGADLSPAVRAAPLGHPLIRHYFQTRTTQWVSIEDLLPGRVWTEHPLYREVFRLAGLRAQLAAAMWVQGPVVISLSLNRGGRDFTEKERQRLDGYRSLWRKAWDRVVELRTAALVRTALETGYLDGNQMLLLFDQHHDQVLYQTEGFAEMLADHPDLWRFIRDRVESPDGSRRVTVNLDRTHRVTLRLSSPDGLTLVRARIADLLGLTDREVQILDAVATGDTAAAIADRLRISLSTVNKHLEHIYAKLGAHDRVTAVTIAREHGIIGR